MTLELELNRLPSLCDRAINRRRGIGLPIIDAEGCE
jgi:hypothetical protein